MRSTTWTGSDSTGPHFQPLVDVSKQPGLLVVEFRGQAGGEPAPWAMIERWTRSRAVTVADVDGSIRGGALEIALCSDLVFVRPEALLELPSLDLPPTQALIWALGRAGPAALARVLLDGGVMAASEAVALGLAHELVGEEDDVPVPGALSVAALTSARDLMRCRATGSAGRALELATFRLLFAAGDPEEGARAFLERREPRFGDGHEGADSDVDGR